MISEIFLFYIFSSIALVSGIMVIRSRNPVHSVLFLILVFCNAAGLLILLDLDFFAMIFLVVYVGAIAVLFLFVVMMLNIKLTEINENILRYLPIGGVIGLIFLFEILLIVDTEFIPLLVTEYDQIAQNQYIHFLYFLFYKIKGFTILFYGYMEGHLEKYTQYTSELNILFSELVPKINCMIPRIEQSFIQELGSFNEDSKVPLKSHLFNSVQNFDNYNYSFESLSNLQSFLYIEWPAKIDTITNIEALGFILYTYFFYFFIMASLILLVAMIGAIVLTMHKGLNIKRQEIFEQNSREFTKTIRKIRY